MEIAVTGLAYGLRHLPDESHSILVRLPKAKYATGAHADSCFAYGRYSVKALIVGARSNNLDQDTAE